MKWKESKELDRSEEEEIQPPSYYDILQSAYKPLNRAGL